MIEFGEGKYKIYLNYFKIGDELLVIIYGGEKPHIGSISICNNTYPFSISFLGHKDYIISHYASEKIFKKLNSKVIVICGIHIENATKEDIEILINNSKKCVEKFLENF
ncbi:MAG: hypothetical protein DSO09_03375 [Candidatus Methanomethylicota archaeon]|uniref:Prenylated flavin chaperone LpdD-like domain-containing protein n=1 Tax=Thermoproteota archaeon TaxID=2056631 RepID=A0A523BD82_9CREN|nr:MAG: hypothetical protein EF809_05995 [Candidatus Verstraetearchaeota archaeon]TDA38898.1 MAG: hypothetical protein DSO09_03375 [Candidatus Verstraetearchaeota archaeon]